MRIPCRILLRVVQPASAGRHMQVWVQTELTFWVAAPYLLGSLAEAAGNFGGPLPFPGCLLGPAWS